MKRLALAVLLILATTSAYSQVATLQTPIVPPPQTTLIVGAICEGPTNPDTLAPAYATVTLWLINSAGHIGDQWTIQMSGNTEVLNFERARSTAVSGENTFTMQNQRILTYLKTANCTTFANRCSTAVAAVLANYSITP